MPLAKSAELLYFKSAWCFLFVFCCCIISVLALCACKRYKLPHLPSPLFYDLGAYPGTYGLAAFPDGKAELFFQGDGGDKFDGNGDIVSGHNHLNAFGELGDTGYVSGSDIELGTIAGEERGMPSTLFLG